MNLNLNMTAWRAAYLSFIASLGLSFALTAEPAQDADDRDARLTLLECELAAARYDLARANAALDQTLLGALAPLDAWLDVRGPRTTLRRPPDDLMPFAEGPLRDDAPFHFTLRLEGTDGATLAAWHFRLTDADRGKVRGHVDGAEGTGYDYEVMEDDEEYAARVRDVVAAQVREFAKGADAEQLDALRAGRTHLYHRPTHDAPPEALNRTLRIY